MQSMGKCNNHDQQEGGLERDNMYLLSPRRESHMVGKSSSSKTGRREWSQVSSPPSAAAAEVGTIRVIHIFAPKIIKTDVTNFRALVQRLTGNKKRSSSSNKCKRGRKSMSPSPPRTRHILSQYCNATQIFTSSNRVEYTIPRSSHPNFSPPSILDLHKVQEEDVKPVRLREPSYVDCSGSSSDQSCCSSFTLAEVTSPYFQGHHLQDPRSVNVNCSIGMPSNNLKSWSGNQRQQQVPMSKPIMVDPFQSLSGYKEKLLPTPHRLSTTTSPLFDDRNHYMFTSRFSDMDILTGLVTPRPLPEFPMALPPHSNSSSDFTFQSGLLNTPNSLCRFAVQFPVRGGISQLF